MYYMYMYIKGDVLKTSVVSLKYIQTHIQGFCRTLTDQGWLREPLLLGPDEWRAKWDNTGLLDKKDV